MLNFTQRSLFQNLHQLMRLRKATVAYQFRVEKPIFYPDRQSEMQRMTEQMKSQLVADQHEPRRLPKDYYYKVLGVRKHATVQQIKAAYYALAKRFHPDASNGKNPPEYKRFQEVSNAYHILSDESKRLEYDQMGTVKDEQSFLNNISNLNKILSSHSANTRPVDVPLQSTREELVNLSSGEPKIELAFLEAAQGTKKKIDLRFLKKCPTCNAKVSKTGRTNSEMCRKCNGTGQLTKKTPTFFSLVQCDDCNGKRYINRRECESCENRGFVIDTLSVMVQIPSGVKTGDLVPIENPRTTQRINYRVLVQDSPTFKRVGNNVFSDRYINISEAVLGGSIKVRGIHETLDIMLEPGTESHSQVVLPKKGIKTKDGIGDHTVTLKIRIPHILTMKTRQLMNALAKTEEPSNADEYK